MVLIRVVTIAGNTMDAGEVLPYWVLYAIIFTGISCRDEMLRTRNVHISLLAVFELPLR